MPFDPAVQSVVDGLSQQGLKPFDALSLDETREAVGLFATLQNPPRYVATVAEMAYPGPGGPQDLRIYVPDAAEPLPVVVYFHGGGFIAGDLSVADEPSRALANDLQAIVVAASYRLAPEHKFPAASDDTFAALGWVVDNISQHGGDPSRIAVLGDSAGGNLAAVAALRARDEGGPVLRAQVLVYPTIDPLANTQSRKECSDGPVISAAALDHFWRQYLSAPEDAENPWAAPSKAASLRDLPPALVLTTEYEVVRDEAEAYGEQLSAAGVLTDVIRFDGLIHGVWWMSGAVPRSAEMHEAIVSFLRDKLRSD
ncbi:alpha/beta hydrolase [Rhodococcus sp. T2V]|uniref:alpha/beta hydrolase n=1 Tax=Rhodococcus sp. T2V TaxID=3034164 RepID=UPI0023E2876E|nr:alpha/beta hydrolase [Rhodococcus sp. T2V]MDF3312825.1 alpha/beta hydrolase [Rhodococcus sp. T2V]